MHLVPPDRPIGRIIDDERVCDAIRAIGEPERLAALARRFALLGDPTRLALLMAMHGAGPISVSDLAVAANLQDTTVSQALRLLRAAGVVSAVRDGRIVRYRVTDEEIVPLLDGLTPVGSKKRRTAL
jgi:DNA-binding transcriptional ArsR family regulator